MKLTRFLESHEESYGIIDRRKIVCVPRIASRLAVPFPQKIETFIAEGLGHKNVENLLKKATEEEIENATYQIIQLRILAPIKSPPKIICLGLNYRDHAEEQGKQPPTEPTIFLKPHTTIIGPEEEIVKPHFVKQLDYEAELAIVMGKKAKNATIEEAKTSIFGYTILNDVSARDIQFRDKQWTRGKSFDTFAPIGPNITTTDEIRNHTDLAIRTWVNGELRQNSNTSNMVLNAYNVVSSLSKVMTLEPCDIISTGTPAGVGFALKPEPKFLQVNDVVEIEIEGIGKLKNKVVEELNKYSLKVHISK
jgi:2-keto-4-pentenoate hydratase/2-oxohepta-3-ene-1,7-dioic acid hydratase in catechol pathway